MNLLISGKFGPKNEIYSQRYEIWHLEQVKFINLKYDIWELRILTGNQKLGHIWPQIEICSNFYEI